jgi:hypothetical protein
MQLYERLLGASFQRLPAALRRFHAQPGGSAEFCMEVTREPGLLRAALAALMRLPAPAASARGRLVVSVQGEREVWERAFPSTKMRTVQRIEAGLLIEQEGPLEFAFDVAANEEGMRLSLVALRCFGCAMPRGLVPRVETTARGNEHGWDLHVSIAVPLLGRLTTYGGPVTPLP